MTNVFKSWSQTRLADYDTCPLMAKLRHLIKLCPKCFKGKLKGGYDEPLICGGCGEEIIQPEAMARGSAIGATLEHYVDGTAKKLHPEIKHPKVLEIAKALRAGFKKGKVQVEKMWTFDRNWKPLPDTGRWNPAAWLYVKTDVFMFLSDTTGRVKDWKSGGINKKTGQPWDNAKYEEQLRIYSTAGLCMFPQINEMFSDLTFVDARPPHDPVVEKKSGNIVRKDLAKHVKALTNRALPLLTDTTFAPRANDRCDYCDFQKGKGGPCPY